MFKLTSEDKAFLMKVGYPEIDHRQIERAANELDYFLEDKKISRDKAIELVGRKEFLTRVARAAFHWTAACETICGKGNVFFDGHRMWRKWLAE